MGTDFTEEKRIENEREVRLAALDRAISAGDGCGFDAQKPQAVLERARMFYAFLVEKPQGEPKNVARAA